jgi:glycosyltransferase involved in cell wall biosynthesis
LTLQWHQLPDCGDLVGWPWKPSQATDPDFLQSELGESAPQVLIVTPSYNQGPFIEQTIRSVLLQGYPNLTYRIIDGGSTDETRQIIDRYRPWIDQVIIEPDEGQSDAICKGIGDRKTGWFNWINSDDWLSPQTLHHLSNAITQNLDSRLHRLIAMNIQVTGDGQPYLMRNTNLNAKSMLLDEDYSFAQPGLWFDLQRLHRCGGIDRNLHYGFDWDLVVRYLSEGTEVTYLDRIGAHFRVHGESKTCVENQKTAAENKFEIEHALVRDKLESQLAPKLAAASRLGRRRRKWNQKIIETLDAPSRSPFLSAWELAIGAIQDPAARLHRRTAMSIVRLLSRYVRPKRLLETDRQP